MEFEDIAIVVLLTAMVFVYHQILGYAPHDGDARAIAGIAHKTDPHKAAVPIPTGVTH
jgi:hypothetical protein